MDPARSPSPLSSWLRDFFKLKELWKGAINDGLKEDFRARAQQLLRAEPRLRDFVPPWDASFLHALALPLAKEPPGPLPRPALSDRWTGPEVHSPSSSVQSAGLFLRSPPPQTSLPASFFASPLPRLQCSPAPCSQSRRFPRHPPLLPLQSLNPLFPQTSFALSAAFGSSLSPHHP